MYSYHTNGGTLLKRRSVHMTKPRTLHQILETPAVKTAAGKPRYGVTKEEFKFVSEYLIKNELAFTVSKPLPSKPDTVLVTIYR